MDSFTIPLNLAEQGPWGLLVGVVAFMFYGVFKGWVIVKLHYDTLLARAIAAETANERLSENNKVLAEAALKTTAVGDTVEKFIAAMQDARQKAVDAP